MAKKKRKKTRRPSSGATVGTRPQERGSPEELAALEADEGDRPGDGGTRTRDERGDRSRLAGSGGGGAAAVSNRQARKEAARRERERRIRAARRRARTRRILRSGLVVGLAAAIGVFVWYRVTSGQRLEADAAAAAERLGCGPVQEPPNLGRSHSPPFVEGKNGKPATSGPHSSPLPAEPNVFDEPVPEANLVHNMEHGYVIVYYQNEGQDALPEDVRSALEDLVDNETEVIMTPYPKLAEGSSLALAAWTRLQMCDVPADASSDDATAVTRYFIDQYRNTTAPEASTP